MEIAVWSLLVGVLLVVVALAGTVLKRLPLTATMLYLGVGLAVSPLGLGLLIAGPLERPVLLERMTEIAVIVSLFTAGLKLSPALSDMRWRLPVWLALTSMVVTVCCITAVGYWLLGLPLGGAVLLGAILAPTDPVLASDVQVHRPGDRDQLRFALTGEGGLNDGTAFPFVMLGLGLLGVHELGAAGWRWWAVDVLWAVSGGLGVGALLGLAIGRLVLYLRRDHKEAVGLDDCLERIGEAYMAQAVLGFNENTSRTQRRLIGWFGIRGIGSLYYLMYAINHGLPQELGQTLVALTLSVVVTSVLVHGISVTPLMSLYERRLAARR